MYRMEAVKTYLPEFYKGKKEQEKKGSCMESKVVYIKAERNIEVKGKDVFLKDIASLSCQNEHLLAKANALKVYKFQEKGSDRAVISIVKVIDMISALESGVTVESVGETDTLVKRIETNHIKESFLWIKVAFVALISFFGTAFTIMAFHNDIGIHDVFGRIYELVMGEQSGGFTTLELSYSAGLALGIIVFFNHIGGRRITKDPTPIEVEMRIYEKDVDDTLIETADREGKTIDVS